MLHRLDIWKHMYVAFFSCRFCVVSCRIDVEPYQNVKVVAESAFRSQTSQNTCIKGYESRVGNCEMVLLLSKHSSQSMSKYGNCHLTGLKYRM